jgi:predicted Zn-dependent peptidase
LTLLLLNPTLASELEAGERLPFRDESAQALGEAWRTAVLAEGKPDLERFVAGLDPATADLARSMLASARTRGARPDTSSDREELRVCLVRMRIQRAEEQLDDLEALIRAASDDDTSDDIRELEQRFQALTREREQLVQAMRGPAVAVGGRSS